MNERLQLLSPKIFLFILLCSLLYGTVATRESLVMLKYTNCHTNITLAHNITTLLSISKDKLKIVSNKCFSKSNESEASTVVISFIPPNTTLAIKLVEAINLKSINFLHNAKAEHILSHIRQAAPSNPAPQPGRASDNSDDALIGVLIALAIIAAIIIFVILFLRYYYWNRSSTPSSSPRGSAHLESSGRYHNHTITSGTPAQRRNNIFVEPPPSRGSIHQSQRRRDPDPLDNRHKRARSYEHNSGTQKSK
eukprot:TRINITY_DN14737_c0_g1_i1.p1 TRINITY_DN14737_c0_g1~~TRINITY_DN14737_c0_g1_i1.p1  ORF type:complete len:268 (-),score=29.22 TRINITY_DN14737_c0_g1_i1:658-1410(-)